MPKRSTKNIAIPAEDYFDGNDDDKTLSFEERIELEKKKDISDVIKSLLSLSNKSYADIGEAILKKVHPLYWKVLAEGIFDIKYHNDISANKNASRLSEIYTNFCLDGRFQFQKGHMWTLTYFLPAEVKRTKRVKK